MIVEFFLVAEEIADSKAEKLFAFLHFFSDNPSTTNKSSLFIFLKQKKGHKPE